MQLRATALVGADLVALCLHHVGPDGADDLPSVVVCVDQEAAHAFNELVALQQIPAACDTGAHRAAHDALRTLIVRARSHHRPPTDSDPDRLQ